VGHQERRGRISNLRHRLSGFKKRTSNPFTTPNPLLKQEGEYLMSAIQEFPLLFQEGVGGGKKIPDFG
jgi:hypothetical protein